MDVDKDLNELANEVEKMKNYVKSIWNIELQNAQNRLVLIGQTKKHELFTVINNVLLRAQMQLDPGVGEILSKAIDELENEFAKPNPIVVHNNNAVEKSNKDFNKTLEKLANFKLNEEYECAKTKHPNYNSIMSEQEAGLHRLNYSESKYRLAGDTLQQTSACKTNEEEPNRPNKT